MCHVMWVAIARTTELISSTCIIRFATGLGLHRCRYGPYGVSVLFYVIYLTREITSYHKLREVITTMIGSGRESHVGRDRVQN